MLGFYVIIIYSIFYSKYYIRVDLILLSNKHIQAKSHHQHS